MTHAQKTLDGWRFWVSCQHARKLNMYSKPSDENPGRDVFEDPNYVNLVVYILVLERLSRTPDMIVNQWIQLN